MPDLGVATIIRSKVATDQFWGVFPQEFLKLAPTNNFSVMAGMLPTLMGAEYTFSFENMNVLRGVVPDRDTHLPVPTVFGRPELSFVQASRVANGAAFGSKGNDLTQDPALKEVGVLF